MRLSCISEALHQQKLNSVTITLLGISPFSPFSLFFLVFKNNLVIRISSTPISTRFYFLLDRGILTVRLIDRLRNSITKKNGRRIFFWEIFTEIIKSLIKILAPPTFFFFPRSNILILEIPRNSAISILTESHLENFTRAEIQYIQPRRIPRIVKRIPIKRLLKVARVIVESRNVLKGEHNPTNLHSLAQPDFHYHCQRYPSIQKRFYRLARLASSLSSGISIRYRFNFFPFDSQ